MHGLIIGPPNTETKLKSSLIDKVDFMYNQVKLRKFNQLVFAAIILFAAFLRLWSLDSVPVSLFGDEIDVGLQAKSILKTGKDYYSHPFPIMFQSFSEYRLPGLLYSAVPTVWLFGLNEWGVRIPAAIYGILSLIGISLIAKQLFGYRMLLITSGLLAISPWHLQFSRQANDTGVLLAFFTLALWFFLKGLLKYRYLVVASILFSLSFYAYATAAVFIPLILLSLFLIFKKDILKFGFIRIGAVILIGCIFLIPYLNTYFNGSASHRFSLVSVFADHTISDDVIERRSNDHLFLTPIYQNTTVAFTYEIIRNYLRAFSTQFLFILGDSNLRNSIGGFGELYLFELLTITLGVIYIIRNFSLSKAHTKGFLLLISWLVIAPIPSSLTRDGGNHAARLLIELPPMMMISALGISLAANLSKFKQVKLILFPLTIFILFNVGNYFYRYYVEWPVDSSRFWQVGYKEAISYLKSVDNNYSEIFINNTYEPSMPRFLFWYDFDPELFQQHFKGDKTEKDFVKGLDGFKIDEKYYFGQFHKPLEEIIQAGSLYMFSARDDITDPSILQKPGINLLKTVYSPKKEPIFYIVTGKEHEK